MEALQSPLHHSTALGGAPHQHAAVKTQLPVLYLSHGSPMFAVEPGETGPALTAWGAALRVQYPDLRGVLVMSPHWTARGAQVTTGMQPATLHDFGGFPPALYALRYPAPGAPDLAQEVLTLLRAAGIAAQGDAQRPLDHGAWVPLMHLFPQADVPVVQLAIPARAGPAEVYALGAAVQALRSAGVLVVGSGSMTHNLVEARPPQGETAAYVLAFRQWVESALERGDVQALLDYRRRAPAAERAHPTEEHFLPLFFALGAGANAGSANNAAGTKAVGLAVAPRIQYISREVMDGTLAMDAFSLTSPA